MPNTHVLFVLLTVTENFRLPANGKTASRSYGAFGTATTAAVRTFGGGEHSRESRGRILRVEGVPSP